MFFIIDIIWKKRIFEERISEYHDTLNFKSKVLSHTGIES